MELLKNKIAVITGTSTGIGRSIALLYAENGAKVVLSGRNMEKNEELAHEITVAGGESIFVLTDVRIPEDCDNLVKKTVSHYGRIDIACNSAGYTSPMTDTAAYDIELWKSIVDTNLNGVFYAMHYQIIAMLASGGGSITNISSAAGQVGMAGQSAYSASKHGIVGLSKSAALEYSKRGIRINVVAPAFIETPMLKKNIPLEAMGALAELHPIGRIGQPEEVAELVLWLSSAKASFVTGGYYPVDGGYLAR